MHINVVGGSKGLGKIFSNLCSSIGWDTSIVARNPEGEDKNSYSCDITYKESISETLNKIYKSQGEINSIVFLQRYRGNADSWDNHYSVSVKAISEYSLQALPFMNLDATIDKSIVIISSISSVSVAPEQDAAYHATRTAQVGLMKYLAYSLGKHGIRVNSVSFGNILKNTNREFFEENKNLKEKMQNCSPLNRMGTSEEISKVIKFLVSNESSWMTGQNLIVDGGASLLWNESQNRNVS